MEGGVSPFATTSSMFALGPARTLTTAEMAKLMGHKLDELNLAGISEAKFRHMLGMSLHKGTAGFLMLGLLAPLGCQCQLQGDAELASRYSTGADAIRDGCRRNNSAIGDCCG